MLEKLEKQAAFKQINLGTENKEKVEPVMLLPETQKNQEVPAAKVASPVKPEPKDADASKLFLRFNSSIILSLVLFLFT